jgi:hypothetical protein
MFSRDNLCSSLVLSYCKNNSTIIVVALVVAAGKTMEKQSESSWE